MADPAELSYVAPGPREGAEMWDAVEQMRQELNASIDARGEEAEATVDTYTAADATDWASPAPTSLRNAVDRLANHIRTGAGANPIVVLP